VARNDRSDSDRVGYWFVVSMLASSLIVLLAAEVAALDAPRLHPSSSLRHIASARSGQAVRKPLPSPTLELKKSTEALRKTLARRHPGWSPEAEAQAASVQLVIDGLLDFEEIAKRTLPTRWDGLTAGQRREFLDTLQKLIERRPLDRNLSIDLDSTVAYQSESIVDDEAVVSSMVTSYKTGRPARRSVEYKLCYRKDRWRLYDVVVEGVSLVDDYREQFSRIIKDESFDGLVKRMKRKLGDDPAN
jgi:phospholipid transport system substrate-binding protein